MQKRTAKSIICALDSLFSILDNQYGIKPKVVECDNEIFDRKPAVAVWLRSKAVRVEPSASYIQSQNGGAERLRGVIKEKERAMRTGAKLPHFLWPKVGKAAVYLYNRTPKYINR